jgi:hypothetical protein
MWVLARVVVYRHTARLLTAASRPRTAPLAMLWLLLVRVWVLAMLLGLLLLGVRVLGVCQWVLGVGVLLLLLC